MQLDDSILKIIEFSNAQELKEARDIIQRIRRRELYQVSYLQLQDGEEVVPFEILHVSKSLTSPRVNLG